MVIESAPTTTQDYSQARREFRWKRPERFNFAVDVVDAWAKRPDLVAMHWVGDTGERSLTYRWFGERSDRLANALKALDLTPGDRVLVMLPRVPEWWVAMLGLEKAALVSMPATSLLTPKDIAYRVDASGASAIVTDASGAEKADAAGALGSVRVKVVAGTTRTGWHSFDGIVDRAAASREPLATPAGEPSLLYFTSGTTGYPKMVLHSHASYGLGHEVTGRYWLGLGPGDLHWNISDTGWAKAAWSSFFGPWTCGATLLVQHSTGKFAAPEILQLLRTHPVNTLCGPPTVYRMLVQEDLAGFSCPTLRHCVAAGEPLNPEVIETWKRATGITIRDGYGQTETVILCGNFPGVDVRFGSMGKPTPGFDLAVINHDGQRLPPGKEGDLAIRVEPERPLGLFLEYWKNPEAMAASFRNGWYVTGDRGMTDADGYFWFVGRADDVIISAGYRIGPFEVESALIEHPAVAEAAAVASPDPMRGAIVKAFVVLAPGRTGSAELAKELQEHVKKVTAPYKYPRVIEFVPSLPKTISGKILRRELRDREEERKKA